MNEIPLTKLFSRFCALKAMDETQPTAKSYRTARALALRFDMIEENGDDKPIVSYWETQGGASKGDNKRMV